MLALSCLLIAFLLALQHSGGLASDQLFMIWATLWTGALLLIARSTRTHQRHVEPALLGQAAPRHELVLPIAVAVFAGALALSVFASPLPGVASEQFFAIALLPAVYFWARLAQAGAISAVNIWKYLHFGAVLLAVFALAEKALTGARSYTVMNDPNALAGVFNVFIVLAFIEHLRQAPSHMLRSRWSVARLLLYAAAAGSTGSLSGLICLTTAVVALAGIATWQRPVQRLAAPALAFAVLALAVLCSRGPIDNPGAKLPGITQHSSFTVRLEMAQASLVIYRDSPWYGSGLATYKLYYPQHRGPLDTGTTGDLAHNDYVQFLLEGGPLLLGTLLALVACAFRIGVSQLPRLRHEKAAWWRLGSAVAALCLFMQAAMNFVFYVAPLAFICGLLLATLQDPPPPQLRRSFASLPVMAGMGLVALLLVGTLGARALFLGMAQERCVWRACVQLRSDTDFMKRMVSFVAGTQPTWIPVRDYLISNFIEGESTAETADQKHMWRQRAMREALAVVEFAPAIAYPFITLGDLVARDPALAVELPADLPRDVPGLYGLALAHRPQSLQYRLQAAAALKTEARHTEAYQVLVTDGGRYWKMGDWGDGGRMHYLVNGIALAVPLGHCTQAAEMAEGLKVFMTLQRQAADAGVQLPLPMGSLSPPPLSESEAALALLPGCKPAPPAAPAA